MPKSPKVLREKVEKKVESLRGAPPFMQNLHFTCGNTLDVVTRKVIEQYFRSIVLVN